MEDYSRLLQGLKEANERNDRLAMRDLVEQIRVILDGEIVSDSGTLEELRHSLDAHEAAAEDGVSPAEKAVGAETFVGRVREIDRLKEFLLEALAGRGRIIMLAGEPGIGKTRTAEELATYAERLRVPTLWGRIHEELGAPPYWPWIQVIRSYLSVLDPEHSPEELSRTAGVISRIVPELAEMLGDVHIPPELGDREAERFRLFDSISRFLKTAAMDSPILIVLDDLHWSDEPSLKLLEFVTNELAGSRVLLVGTYRDVELRRTHPLSRVLGDIGRSRRLERIVLRGLSRDDVSRLVELSAGKKPGSELVDSIYTHTEGNPLFAVEVIRYLEQEGRLTEEGAIGGRDLDLKIPEGVREVIGRRLDRLSEICNRVLKTASVVGRDFSVDVLALLIDDLGEDRISEVLGEALSIRIIDELSDALNHYRFGHKLIQETLSEELTLTERVRLHAQIAEALEELYGDTVEEHAAELSVHFAEAQILLGTEKLVTYSLIAGKRAVDQSALEDSLVIYIRAIAATKELPMDDEIAELYWNCALGQWFIFEMDQAAKKMILLFNYYEKEENVSDLIQVQEWLQNTFMLTTGPVKLPVRDLARRTLELYDRRPTEDPTTLTSVAGIQLFVSGSDGEAKETLIRALEKAEELADTELQRQVLLRWSFYEGDSRAYSAIERYEKAMRIVPEDASSILTFFYLIYASGIYLVAGNLDESERRVGLAARQAEDFGVPRFLAMVCLSKCKIASMRGDWDRSRRNFDDGVDIIERSGITSPERLWFLAGAALTSYEVGDFERGRSYVVELHDRARDPESSRFIHLVICGTRIMPLIARITGTEEWFDLAAEASEYTFSIEPRSRDAMLNSGLMAAVRGDSRGATRWYEKVLGEKGEIGAYLGNPLGVIAHTAGRVEESIAHFEEGYVFARDAEYRPTRAWICRDYAEALLARGMESDTKRADLLLGEGLKLSEELGMKPLRESIQKRRDVLAPAVGPAYPAGLTQREVEVLRLISGGKTNQEIGYELSISIKTVATHIRHIFEKTGVANRAQAASYAHRHGIAVEGKD